MQEASQTRWTQRQLPGVPTRASLLGRDLSQGVLRWQDSLAAHGLSAEEQPVRRRAFDLEYPQKLGIG